MAHTHCWKSNATAQMLWWTNKEIFFNMHSSKGETMFRLFVWLRFHVPVNSYGHVKTISSHLNHTLASLTKVVSQFSVHILWLVTDNINLLK